ncbi:MAG: hypothetical protein JKY31_03110 [Rhodobacteraceae bacterium]|nr:hypothetical protein [Paracoccaceae bacterium]
MSVFLSKSGLLLGLVLALPIQPVFAQSTDLQNRMDETARICAQNNRPDCMATTVQILDEMAENTSDEVYDTSIANFALSIAIVWDASMPTATCGLLADSLAQISASSSDPSQSGRILTLSEIVRGCDSAESSANTFLASPN